ncbi:transposase [Streptomyces sp. NPDC054804]
MLSAWIAQERLRTPLALARTGADRHRIGQARYRFLTGCADTDIPEVRTLAVTVDRWWNEIATFIDSGHSNAKSEGINRVIKLVVRAAFGPRIATNQRLRTRCVTTRRVRGHLRTARL